VRPDVDEDGAFGELDLADVRIEKSISAASSSCVSSFALAALAARRQAAQSQTRPGQCDEVVFPDAADP
jgi:hypothetical protein